MLDVIEQLFARTYLRAPKRIVLDASDVTGPQWIFDDVPDHVRGRLVVAQSVLVSVPLPQGQLRCLLEVETRVLLCAFDEGLQVRVFAQSLDEKMRVFAHEAVRRKRKARFVESTHDLRPDDLDVSLAREVFVPLERAER